MQRLASVLAAAALIIVALAAPGTAKPLAPAPSPQDGCTPSEDEPFPQPGYYPRWAWDALMALRKGDTVGWLAQLGIGMAEGNFMAFEMAARGYEEPMGCLTKNDANAAAFYAKAVELGRWSSMLRLGNLTLWGHGVPADDFQGVALVRRGLLRLAGSKDGLATIATTMGDRPVHQKFADQLDWFQTIAVRPNPQAVAVAEEFLQPGTPLYDPVGGNRGRSPGGQWAQ